LLVPNKLLDRWRSVALVSTSTAIVVNGTIYGDPTSNHLTRVSYMKYCANRVAAARERSDYLKDQQNSKSFIVLVNRNCVIVTSVQEVNRL